MPQQNKGQYKMKYQPTLNIWNPEIHDDVLSGKLKLQRGQWLRCGNSMKPCRFIGVDIGRSIDVVHWQGNAKDTNALFMNRCLPCSTIPNKEI